MTCEVQETNVQTDHGPFDPASSAEIVDLRIHGAAEGHEGESRVQCVLDFATAPLLGQSLLGEGYCLGTAGLDQETYGSM